MRLYLAGDLDSLRPVSRAAGTLRGLGATVYAPAEAATEVGLPLVERVERDLCELLAADAVGILPGVPASGADLILADAHGIPVLDLPASLVA